MRNPLARLAKRDPAKLTLKQRASALKAKAKRALRRPSDQPSPETLPAGAPVEGALSAYRGASQGSHDGFRDLTADPGRNGALGTGEHPMGTTMGRHETFDSSVSLADTVLAGTMLEGARHITSDALDPILSAIDEARRLDREIDVARELPQPVGSVDPLPEQVAARDAFFTHCDDVLLKTVPTTAAGCAALARYAVEYRRAEGIALDEDDDGENVRILDLIARSPLHHGLVSQRDRAPLPQAGSDEARAAWRAACQEHSRLTQFAHDEYPELMRSMLESWTKESLGRACDSGEITVREYAHLHPIASERELRMEMVSHRLNLSALFALAYANEHPDPEGEADGQVHDDSTAERIKAHQEAAAALQPHFDTLNETLLSAPEYAEIKARAEPLRCAEAAVLRALIATPPTSLAGLAVLTDYLPSILIDEVSVQTGDDIAIALCTVSDAVRTLAAQPPGASDSVAVVGQASI